GKVPASSIIASAPSDKNLDAWRESGCRTTHCNLEVLQESTLVFLATKPHVLPGVLQEIRPAWQRGGLRKRWHSAGTGSPVGHRMPAEIPPIRGWGLGSLLAPHSNPNALLPQVYLFAEALAEGAVKMGMPGALATRIAAQTMLGAAKMMLESGEHPAKLRGDVCTPGGTTIHALHQLEKGALRATVMNAVEAATNRACDMAED
ncbi:Pyrroline-5-carboxylate reductase 3, partial [Phalacrocorax carbo]